MKKRADMREDLGKIPNFTRKQKTIRFKYWKTREKTED